MAMVMVMVMTMMMVMMMIVLAERIGEGLLYYAARPVPPFPLIDYHHHSTIVIILEENMMLVSSVAMFYWLFTVGELAIKILDDSGSVSSQMACPALLCQRLRHYISKSASSLRFVWHHIQDMLRVLRFTISISFRKPGLFVFLSEEYLNICPCKNWAKYALINFSFILLMLKTWDCIWM